MIRPVNDFRIGSLVLDEDGELCKIEQLSSEKMKCFQQVSNIENKSCISTKYPSNIYAIELTEEWLLKAGFRYKKYNPTTIGSTNVFGSGLYISQMFSNGFSLVFQTDRKNFYFEFSDRFIKYVHELQNIYFALTGVELVFSSTEP